MLFILLIIVNLDCPEVVQKDLSVLNQNWGDRVEEEFGDYSISPELVNHSKDDEGYAMVITKSQKKKKKKAKTKAQEG